MLCTTSHYNQEVMSCIKDKKLHRDIKCHNILLDEEFNAHLANFGLAKLMSPESKPEIQSQVAGSHGCNKGQAGDEAISDVWWQIGGNRCGGEHERGWRWRFLDLLGEGTVNAKPFNADFSIASKMTLTTQTLRSYSTSWLKVLQNEILAYQHL
ncbi:hypothetical protein O6H91_14G042200 [Diphasiastrum complanatum]|uniref:Uncharacterized protein n=1 Tax=Diphasiastrum complanatum TaxID=34168 RepID=A0ACC2BNS3_DIPCM|nr:hypothetical protein O6H91_14G042200 [Diphasiastrum complanatum]